MGHGSKGCDAVITICNRTGCSRTSSDVGRSCAKDRCRRPVCPSGAELHDRSALGSSDDTVGFCGNQALMVDNQQKHGLDKLRLDHRSSYGQNRFVWKNGCSLWYCPNITSELKVSQIVEKAFTENIFSPEEFYIFCCEVKTLQILYCLLYTCHNGIASAIGNFSEEHVKIGDVFNIT